MKIANALIIACLLWGAPLPGQEPVSVSGRVLDARTKEPLVGVNVVVADENAGAATDPEGKFTIDRLPGGTYRLNFSYVGYVSETRTDVVVNNIKPANITVELLPRPVAGDEVTVTAGYFYESKRVQSSTVGLSREEVRRFPGGFEDVVRTVSTLPGVAINTSGGRNDLLVRGGGPSENLFVINNIDVPNINHFSTQGSSSGSLSFVNLDFVENVTFSTGGFGVRYGDKMSSVLRLDMAEGRTDRPGGKGLISATQFGINIEGPLSASGNFIVSARQSYLDLIFKAAGLPFIPVYTDFNVLAHYDLSPEDQLFVLGLAALDRVERDQSSEENRVTNAGILDNTQNLYVGGLNYRRLLPRGYLDATINVNHFAYRFSQVDADEIAYFNSKANETENGLKIQHYHSFGERFGLFSGLSTRLIRNDNETVFADTIYDRSGNRVPAAALGLPPRAKIDASAGKHAAFLEFDWRVFERLSLTGGLRADYYGFIDNPFYLAPRLAARFRVNDKISLRVSGGRYYQSPSYVWTVNPLNRQLKALFNDMAVAGWDILFREDLRLTVEGYIKDYGDLPTGSDDSGANYIVLTNTGTGFGGREDDFLSFGYFPLVSSASGRAFGMDILLQKKYSAIPCYGQVGISLSKSEVVAGNGRTYPNQYDQRFIFNLSGGYKFSSTWEISSRFRLFSGIPFTPVYRPSDNPLNPGKIQNVPEEYLSERLAPGHSLDVRVDRYFYFRSLTMTLYADIQNIYNYQTPIRPNYDFWEDTIETSSTIGILPSIGFSIEF